MQIVKGKIEAPIRAVIYGPEGIGKSTLASRWPKPLFVDAEAGTLRLDVDRVQPQSWAAVLQVVDELARHCNGYRTLVFDTADWLEKMAASAVCAQHNQAGIESFGYGKGYTFMAEEWRKFLDRVAAMQAKNGMHALFLGHACMRKFEQPDEAGAYDRWELKLSKQVAPAMKEWADLVLLANYETIVVEADGKHKAQGGRRVIHTTHHPCWDAKNRFDLPARIEIPADKLPAELARLFSTSAMTAAAVTQPTCDVPAELSPATAFPEQKTAAVSQPAEPSADPAKAKLLAQLRELMTGDGVRLPELQAELARKGVVPADMHPRDYNEATLTRIVGKWEAVSHNIRINRHTA